MEFNENPKFSPFNCFAKPKCPLSKARFQVENNPFQYRNSDYRSFNFNTTIKSKPRPNRYPNLDLNPFKNEGKAPFRKSKDKSRYNDDSPNPNNNSFISSKKNPIEEDDDSILLRVPKKHFQGNGSNINICDGNFLKNNNPFQNMLLQPQSNIKENKKEKDEKSIFDNEPKEKDEETKMSLIADIDNNMNAPAPISPLDLRISTFRKRFEKLNLGNDNELPSEVQKSICQNEEDKIFTNDGDDHLGDDYFY
jgi:hypothetical protein